MRSQRLDRAPIKEDSDVFETYQSKGDVDRIGGYRGDLVFVFHTSTAKSAPVPKANASPRSVLNKPHPREVPGSAWVPRVVRRFFVSGSSSLSPLW
ncbi:hypothetical protein SAMN02745225_02214 [Ferrithrix thermotolerans DSM 19514]|uniref:Uncharacterized protein n=1 Tax=Ferrithrix thermotolerans DSM 19514 TaxID=1121881 RepID=A0A1M4Y2U6_9ACTN|nr:hypothetical protein SAMN02745225_02214 [Ferrithrix thermotolerans DSM 19514]